MSADCCSKSSNVVKLYLWLVFIDVPITMIPPFPVSKTFFCYVRSLELEFSRCN